MSENLLKIENTGKPLGKLVNIKNGFATLKNKAYLFTPIRETKRYFVFEKEGNEFKIEKGICRNAIKPNTLKSVEEIEERTEKLIFPYTINALDSNLFGSSNCELKIIEENTLKSKYPNAYKYLETQKDVLAMRDKGKREYEAWYAYGRNQALLLSGNKLLFPYITKSPRFVFTEDEDLMFYNGYAILSDSVSELQILQKILMSSIFWYYIKHTSKPYEGGYFSVAKNYIKNFGVCELDDSERSELLTLNTQAEVDEFLMRKYDLVIEVEELVVPV